MTKLDSGEVMFALQKKYDPSKWAFFEELRIGTGFTKDSQQRLDAWCINYLPSKRNVSISFEIKISKGDFKNEIKKPFKRRAGLRLSNEFYFVTPKDMLSVEDINSMPECGLMEVDKDGIITTKVQAPFRDIMPPTWLFLSAISRRMDKDRYRFYKEMAEADLDLIEKGNAAIRTIDDHILKWETFSDGNKEIPDKIADAMKHLKLDIEESIENNRNFK